MTPIERIKLDETKDRHSILADEYYYRFFIKAFFEADKETISKKNKKKIKSYFFHNARNYFISLGKFLESEIPMTYYLFKINSQKKSQTLAIAEIFEIINRKNIMHQQVLRGFYLLCLYFYEKYKSLILEAENTLWYLKKNFSQLISLFTSEASERKKLVFSELNAKNFITTPFFNERVSMTFWQEKKERFVIYEDEENNFRDFSRHFLEKKMLFLKTFQLLLELISAEKNKREILEFDEIKHRYTDITSIFGFATIQAIPKKQHAIAPHQYGSRLSLFALREYEEGELPRPLPRRMGSIL